VEKQIQEMNKKQRGKVPDVDSTNTPSSIGTFWVFEHGGIYTLKLRHDPLWFQINHHLPESNSEARHSGLLIITVNTSGSTHSVETYRNANWHMPGSNKVLGEFFNTKELNWQDFDSLIGSSTIDETNVEILDSKLGGPWHAVPDGGTRYSWEYRNFWNWATEEFKKESANIVGDSNASYYRVSARLLAFRPTLQLDSKLPVTFYTQADHGDVIFMATYILEDGDQDLRKWYWFKIE
jgi:hypothetical protein